MNMWHLRDFVVKDALGQGQFGEVFKVQREDQFYAMKRVPLRLAREGGVPESTLREIACLQELKHPNLVHLYKVLVDGVHTYLILELMDLSLADLLISHPPQTKFQMKVVLHDILQGLVYLNLNNTMHRDIKPDNVLLKRNGAVKLGDFGLARSFGLPLQQYTPEVITQWYRPPELLLGSKCYSYSIDIWSIGCVWVEMLRACKSGTLHNSDNQNPRNPYQLALFPGSQNDLQQLVKIFQTIGSPTAQTWPKFKDFLGGIDYGAFGVYPGMPWSEIVPGLDEVEYDLLSKMVVLNPECRSSAIDILSHTYFDDVRYAVSGVGYFGAPGFASPTTHTPERDEEGTRNSGPSPSPSPDADAELGMNPPSGTPSADDEEGGIAPDTSEESPIEGGIYDSA
eukprot:TRINITY_DN6068_c0_g2_i2.p1 TRINITY_DN6068_c0_g2~~TRINITY_DN6068_c0_g2_i2.p1  ORF type:complete len:425 (-),score=78.44 TRINITY_DN6068_c0_g2_i2:1926-3116(-)